MKSIFVGLLVGLVALGFTFVFSIEVNLVNYLLGYVAGAVAMLIISQQKDVQDGDCALCGGEVVDSIPAFCKQCRVQDPPRK